MVDWVPLHEVSAAEVLFLALVLHFASSMAHPTAVRVCQPFKALLIDKSSVIQLIQVLVFYLNIVSFLDDFEGTEVDSKTKFLSALALLKSSCFPPCLGLILFAKSGCHGLTSERD